MQTEALMLDTHEKRPLYLQLTDALLKQIVDEYQADDKLPTEMELCDEYAVSRTTVRLAMSWSVVEVSIESKVRDRLLHRNALASSIHF